ncbi:hypothetical protein EDD11_000707 [Mortierella claussenii]|nr:hypothetical protein EDD11_000707 [Mortierella claussenii]
MASAHHVGRMVAIAVSGMTATSGSRTRLVARHVTTLSSAASLSPAIESSRPTTTTIAPLLSSDALPGSGGPCLKSSQGPRVISRIISSTGRRHASYGEKGSSGSSSGGSSGSSSGSSSSGANSPGGSKSSSSPHYEWTTPWITNANQQTSPAEMGSLPGRGSSTSSLMQRIGSTSASTSASAGAGAGAETGVNSMTFPMPLSKVSSGPEPLPYLDFRTNTSREVYYTNNDEEVDAWLQSTESVNTKMWALDCEWKPYDVRRRSAGRVALIQLGNDKTVYLFHVFHMNKFPTMLARILEDKEVLKVGINIQNDGTKIMKDWGVGCVSLVELGVISFQLQDDPTQRKVRSMEKLTKELLGHAVEKDKAIRMCDWQRKSLSSSQLAYAANDVFVTYEVAKRIKQLQESRPSPLEEYVVRLTTINAQGATAVHVRGTLQEREDRPATAQDIVDEKRKAGSGEGKQDTSTETFSMMTAATATDITMEPTKKAMTPKVTTKAAAASPASTSMSKVIKSTLPKTRQSVNMKSLRIAKARESEATTGLLMNPTASSSSISFKSAWTPKPTSTTASLSSTYLYETVQSLRYGSKSVVRIIRRVPASPQKRSFTHQCRQHQQQGRKVGDMYVPQELLPEPLEGKDVLERNQTVWMEAGGRRDLSEEGEIDESEGEDQDWHLRQNQALFQSLTNGSLEDHEDLTDVVDKKKT